MPTASQRVIKNNFYLDFPRNVFYCNFPLGLVETFDVLMNSGKQEERA